MTRYSVTGSHRKVDAILIVLTIASVFLLYLMGSAARGQDLMQRSCVRGTCTWLFGPAGGGLGSVIEIPSSADGERTDQEWVDFCKPEAVRDSFGVTRYRYAHPGCEFGRRK